MSIFSTGVPFDIKMTNIEIVLVLKTPAALLITSQQYITGHKKLYVYFYSSKWKKATRPPFTNFLIGTEVVC